MGSNVVVRADLSRCDKKYWPLLQKAVDFMPPVLSHPSFAANLQLEMISTEGELGRFKGFSATAVYYALFKTQIHPIECLLIELELKTYYSPKRVIGYGVASTKTIHLNTKYLRNYDIGDINDIMKIGSNLLHEHSHDCGMSHDFKRTKRRPHSLSYILNRVYEKTFREVYWSTEDYIAWLAEGEKDVKDKYYKLPWYRAIWPWNW